MIADFRGKFDGQNHILSNLNRSTTQVVNASIPGLDDILVAEDYVGFFKSIGALTSTESTSNGVWVENNAEVKNLLLADCYFYVNPFRNISHFEMTKLLYPGSGGDTNCNNGWSVKSSNTGILAAVLISGTISNCAVLSSEIEGGYAYVGGMVASVGLYLGDVGHGPGYSSPVIEQCFVADVDIPGCYSQVGGLAGSVSALAVIKESFSTGEIYNLRRAKEFGNVCNIPTVSVSSASSQMGGLVGALGEWASISDCYTRTFVDAGHATIPAKTGLNNGKDDPCGVDTESSELNQHTRTDSIGGLIGSVNQGVPSVYPESTVTHCYSSEGFSNRAVKVWTENYGNGTCTLGQYSRWAGRTRNHCGGSIGYSKSMGCSWGTMCIAGSRECPEIGQTGGQEHWDGGNTTYSSIFWDSQVQEDDNGENDSTLYTFPEDVDDVGTDEAQDETNMVSSAYIFAETTTNMKTESTYVNKGWDFYDAVTNPDGIWYIGDDPTTNYYPVLRNTRAIKFYPQYDINNDGFLNADDLCAWFVEFNKYLADPADPTINGDADIAYPAGTLPDGDLDDIDYSGLLIAFEAFGVYSGYGNDQGNHTIEFTTDTTIDNDDYIDYYHLKQDGDNITITLNAGGCINTYGATNFNNYNPGSHLEMKGGNAFSLSANKGHSIKMDGGAACGATISYQGSMEMNGGYVKSIRTFRNFGGSAIDITGGTIGRLTIEGYDQTANNLAIATITDDPLTDDLIFEEYILVGYEGIVHMDGGSFVRLLRSRFYLSSIITVQNSGNKIQGAYTPTAI